LTPIRLRLPRALERLDWTVWTLMWTQLFHEPAPFNQLKNMVDVTGIEPVTPCLQIQKSELEQMKKNEKE
jgi:hypothetical protein